MTQRIIPVLDHRKAAAIPLSSSTRPLHVDPAATTGTLLDAHQRPLRDLRISVTDRCNFRCSYCMPKAVFDNKHLYLPHSALLSFEEITRVARQFVAHGVEKIRLTGGEPLLRKNLEDLVTQLAQVRSATGQALDLTLTTNGSLLTRKAQALRDAGLQRLTVSLDALDDSIFRRMNDVDFPVADVLEGIEAAQRAGFEKIKVNMVIKRGTNEQEILPMARHFKGTGVTLRFIEYMDVGATNGWCMDEVLSSQEVIARLQTEFPLVPLAPTQPGETAQRWAYADDQGQPLPHAGEIGVISSVTQAFCHACTRARLSTEGQLYLCLFASQGHDLRSLLRSNATDHAIQNSIAHIWQSRHDRYSQLRGQQPEAEHGVTSTEAPSHARRRVEMSYIGG